MRLCTVRRVLLLGRDRLFARPVELARIRRFHPVAQGVCSSIPIFGGKLSSVLLKRRLLCAGVQMLAKVACAGAKRALLGVQG